MGISIFSVHFILFLEDGSMLVLSRKRNEQIVIADDIVITVIGIRGDKVRLGIEAPQAVPVHRYEVWVQRQEDGQLVKTETDDQKE